MTHRPGSLAWRARYATGIPSIDAHHQGMFKILRMLQEATRSGHMEAEVGRVIQFLEKYSRAHFEGEEAFMGRSAFLEAAAHSQEHARFTAHLRHLKGRFDAGDQEVPGELVLLLHAWLKEHILHQDMAFAEHVRASGQP
jgi:hemerythrin